jgi:PhnB protein
MSPELPSRAQLAPMLSVRQGAQALEFYKKAFGAAELLKIESPDGAVVAKLSIGDGEFWVSDESPQHQNFSPESLGGATSRMVLTVIDPDGLFAQALSAGATEVSAVEDQDYGWRVGRVVDPYGHHWEIGCPLG